MPKNHLPAEGGAMPKVDTTQILQAEDTLCEAAHLVTCIMMACADLEEEGQRSPLDTVAMVARDKIREAMGMLEETRAEMREGKTDG